MSVQSDYIKKLEDDLDKINSLHASLKAKQDEVTIHTLSEMVGDLQDTIGEMLRFQSKKEYFDKSLPETFLTGIGKIADAIDKKPAPKITVPAANITVDITPIRQVLSDVSSQNKILISLIEKIPTTTTNKGNDVNTEKLYNMVSKLVASQTAFLENGFKQIDFSKNIDAVSEAIISRPANFVGRVTKRVNGQLEEFTINAINPK